MTAAAVAQISPHSLLPHHPSPHHPDRARAAGSLRAELRLRTAAAHEALECTPLMEQLARGTASMTLYRDYLQRQLRLHAAFEPPLRAWLGAACSKLRRVKSEWLRSDLLAAGERPDPRPLPAPVLRSKAAAMGMLHVLEGSTLGLQVVRRHLAPAHPAAGVAGRFLTGYGPQTGQHWRDFIALLDALPLAQWPAAIDAACATFVAFEREFSEPHHD